MLRLVKADNGMNIVGQGGVIMLFTLPAAGCAVAARMLIPELVRIPLPRAVLLPFAAALLFAGLALWATALVQLLRDFPRGKLVRSGAYGVCRNPIYSSFALFVLPGLSAFAATWVYGVVGAILCLGVWVFIRKEERELLRVFGDEYREYTARVHRLIPFARGRQVVEQGAPVAHEVFHDKQ